MDFSGDTSRPRVVGDYEIGPRIGSGSFAVVYKARHRVRGTYFAIKEIDKKHLNENLRKEIVILGKVDHPNIIRLFEAIETEERIYIVLEYCDGGDLAAYLHKHGRVPVDIAKHFMRQLAAGLQILRDNNLIHRDLKPQNLLLSSNMTLKIADFGFARYLTPHGLADTLCGSPLYMAPEIIQSHKYDAKADLWSVGAILFQLVTGRPPYGGNSQLELFQNILASSELQFPKAALEVLDPDCMELCKSLLRRNPVERLTFEEFFNHKFLVESRVEKIAEHSDSVSHLNFEAHRTEMTDEQSDIANLNSSGSSSNYSRYPFPPRSHGLAFSPKSAHLSSLSQPKASESLELIDGEYVLVNSHHVSMETLPSFNEKTMTGSSIAKPCCVQSEKNVYVARREVTRSQLSSTVNTSSSVSDSLSSSTATGDAHDTSASHPSSRMRILLQHAHVLSDLAEEKINSGSFLESLSVELVVLAIWKEAIQIGFSLQGSSEIKETLSCKEISDGHSSSSNMEDNIDFSKPSSILNWAERGFILACERAENLSKDLQDTDGKAEMPNAMDIIYRIALDAGKTGAVDELVGNQIGASVSYTKAMLLLTFIVAEAPNLPLSPPFTLTPGDKRRLLKYIQTLDSHRSRSLALQRQQSNQPLHHSSFFN